MNQTYVSSKRHKQIFLLALIGLLILRIPFVVGMQLFHIQWEWASTVFNIGTYLLTTFLIWWEAENLAEYHIDTFAIGIIALSNPIYTLISRYFRYGSPLDFPNLPSLLIWLTAAVFSLGMWLKRSKLPAVKSVYFSKLILGILAGLATSVILSLPKSLEIPSDRISPGFSTIGILVNIPIEFLYQLGFAAVMEEPLFRGFLWGYLRKLKWREVWIWLFQASLFMISHFYYINRFPLTFWIGTPVSALVLGWLAWRSRTIATSMVAHGIMNATGYAFGYLIARIRLG